MTNMTPKFEEVNASNYTTYLVCTTNPEFVVYQYEGETETDWNAGLEASYVETFATKEDAIEFVTEWLEDLANE